MTGDPTSPASIIAGDCVKFWGGGWFHVEHVRQAITRFGRAMVWDVVALDPTSTNESRLILSERKTLICQVNALVEAVTPRA